ncbi:hypothetical protein GCG21_01240 [Pseudactinotalea sp. HY160]|uniref:SipW-dependent-type signal peptide-containing protein n=1 Tax=Pseudactinotalea sp. HY160 TaxID=2654490 RepID=UPI00128DA850|nr:SipW-dependent-type signal peptide-containing protein [Pseudactinotalea sp. HY160]MPV48656.1 hypothetical protein [Pseudactinotalea sp. HY160]
MAAAACAAAALALTVGLAASGTDAAWQASERAEATFTAATLGSIESPGCTSGGIAGLLASQVKLSWERPTSLSQETDVSYEVSWAPDAPPDGPLTVQGLEYTFDAPSKLLGTTMYVLTVTPVANTWRGEPFSYKASVTSALTLPVTAVCLTP